MKPGFLEILVVVILIAVLFGAKKLPEIGKNLGKGWQGFKKGLKDTGVDEVSDDVKKTGSEMKKDIKDANK